MKGFGIIEPTVRVGWIEKEAPKAGLFEAVLEPVALCPCTSDVDTAMENPNIAPNRILGHEAASSKSAPASRTCRSGTWWRFRPLRPFGGISTYRTGSTSTLAVPSEADTSPPAGTECSENISRCRTQTLTSQKYPRA